jgi:choline dehydrogenase-like flavoprotein
MIRDARSMGRNIRETADVVIVGSGAGGAPMAYELAVAGWKVIVVEEGRAYKVNQFNRDTWAATREMYRDVSMTATLGNPPIPLPLGLTLGGTTTVNSGTCFRTPAWLFAQWKQDVGLGDMDFAELVADFEAVEDMIGVADVPFELMGANNQLFAAGAKKLGLHGAPLKRNSRGCKGAGLCAFGCPNEAKQSMSLTYIPAASAKGAHFYTSVRIDKVHTHGGRASGVSGVALGDDRKPCGTVHIDAPVVVLACGTIYTPYLLLKNKLANRSGQVGRNLRVHPAAKVVGVFAEDIHAWSGVPQAYYVDEYHKEGLMFEGFFVPPGFLAFALPAFGMRLKEYMADYAKLAGFGVMVSDTSHGRVRVGPDHRPLMTYRLNQYDTDKFVRGVEIASRVYFEAGAKKVLPPIFGIEEINHPDELPLLRKRRVRPSDLELIAFHPMGTCRMGDDPKTSVLDHEMQTHDVKGLYVADGSVFPSSLGVNPQLSIMAFSRYAARRMIAKAGVAG